MEFVSLKHKKKLFYYIVLTISINCNVRNKDELDSRIRTKTSNLAKIFKYALFQKRYMVTFFILLAISENAYFSVIP